MLACRNPQKAATALDAVIAVATGPKPEVLQLDLADLASVRRAAEQLNDTVGRIDLLINNAGVMAVPHSRTADGFDAQFGTNHLGHFAFIGGVLRAEQPRRVVTVSSVAAWVGVINWLDPNWQRMYLRWPASGAAGSELRAVAAHPGVSATHLYDRNGEKGVNAVLAAIPQAVLFALAQSDRMGALPQLYAATVPEIRGKSYVGTGFELAEYPRRTLRNPLAYRHSTARELWELS